MALVDTLLGLPDGGEHAGPDSRTIRLLLELRSGGVTDTRVLAAMERTPRDLFVPEPFRDQAYTDVALPLGTHQSVSAPSVVGRMTEALDVGERMKVLEIGTGSGYHAAVLSRLCRRLYTVERRRDLVAEAERRFARLGLPNITSRVGDGLAGWPEQAPFDRIMVTAAASRPPETLLAQLKEGGTMVVPVGIDGRDQRLLRLHRGPDGFDVDDLGPVVFVPLVPEASARD